MTTIKRIVHAQVCSLISVEIWSEQSERGQVAHFARYLSLCLYRRFPESMTDRHVIPAQRRACAWECCGVAAFVGRMWEDTFLGPPATGPLQTNTDSVRRSPWKPQWHQQSREVKVPFVPSEEILGLTDKPEVGVWGLYFCRRHTSLFKKTVFDCVVPGEILPTIPKEDSPNRVGVFTMEMGIMAGWLNSDC